MVESVAVLSCGVRWGIGSWSLIWLYIKEACSRITHAHYASHKRRVAAISSWHFSDSLHLRAAPEMSVRMSNLDNERDERDEDSHEDRGISECCLFTHQLNLVTVFFTFNLITKPGFVLTCVFSPLAVSNTRFIAAVIERHTHTPERRRRYWGRSGTESDHGKT